MKIREYRAGDEIALCDIYNYYIANTVVTFEEVLLTEAQLKQRIDSNRQSHPWYVCELDDEVIGYSYASKFHQRSAYRYTAEASVYVKNGLSRRGVGRALYGMLLPELEKRGFHSVMGSIALPHEASVALHESFGFAKVAHFAEVGRKFDRWIDVGYWQKRFRQQENAAL